MCFEVCFCWLLFLVDVCFQIMAMAERSGAQRLRDAMDTSLLVASYQTLLVAMQLDEAAETEKVN